VQIQISLPSSVLDNVIVMNKSFWLIPQKVTKNVFGLIYKIRLEMNPIQLKTILWLFFVIS